MREGTLPHPPHSQSSMTIPPHTLTLIRLAAAVAAIVVIAAVASPTTHAQQVDDSLPPLADLAIASQYHPLADDTWVVTVNNNTVGAHPGIEVALVKVRVTISDPVGGDRTHIWTIENLPVGGSASREWTFLRPPRPATSASEKVPQRLYAEIIESEPAEPETPRMQFNNATEHWTILAKNARNQSWIAHTATGDAGVEIIGISDRFPRAGGATTFTVHVENASETLTYPRGSSRIRQDDAQLDVQVEISLSRGLSLAAGQEAPDGTTFDSTTGIWNVGTLGSQSLPVAVNLTTYSLADLPLEDRCLTAKVVRAVPWFHSQTFKRQNDTATACLGKVLLSSGELDLVTFYPCIGVTSHPCNNADTLELVVKWGDEYLQPEAVLFHVPDPGGQGSKFGSPIWTTNRMMDLRDSQDKLTSSWSIKESVKVTAPGGGDAPGRWLLTTTDDSPDGNFDLLDAMDSATVSYEFYDLSEYGTNPADYFLDVKVDFWALGTYKALYGISGRLSGATYTDSGTYTFHVGPISDLEAEAAWARPGVFIVTARNNGPDIAPAAQVRVSLQTGMRFLRAEAGKGSYDPVSGVWNIGRLTLAEHATLIVYTEPTGEAVTEPVTASIENTQDYCVRRGRNPAPDLECTGSLPAGYTEHSTAYYDHRLGNNVARLAAPQTAPASDAITRVTGMSVTSSPDPSKGYYLSGQDLEVEATFSDPVTATAGARLRLQVGRSLREATAVPSTGEAIRFRYRVQWDDRTDPGEGISVPPYPFAGTEALKAAGGRTLWLAFPGQDLGSGHAIGPQPDRVWDEYASEYINIPEWSDPVFLTTGQEGARYRFIDGMRHYYVYDSLTQRWMVEFRIADDGLSEDDLDLIQWLYLRGSGYYSPHQGSHPYTDDADPVAGKPWLGRWNDYDHKGNQICWGLASEFSRGKTRVKRLEELGDVTLERIAPAIYGRYGVTQSTSLSTPLSMARSGLPEPCPKIPEERLNPPGTQDSPGMRSTMGEPGVQDSPEPEGMMGQMGEPGVAAPPAIVTGLAMRSSGPYAAGDAVSVAATFDWDVTVAGTPEMNIEVGGSSRAALYQPSPSDAAVKVFSYTVREGDQDADGVSVYPGSIVLPPGASIRDAQGADADLTIAGLPPQPGHTVDGSQEGQSAQRQAASNSEPQTVPADWPLIPEGIGPGDSFRLLFVTSSTTTATSTDIADYNAFAQAAVTNTDLASFSDQFRALISTASVNIRDNSETTGTGVPVHWLGGDKVADDYADLYDLSWDSVSGMTETDSSYTGLVWTGSNGRGETSLRSHAGAAQVRMGDLGEDRPLSSPTTRAATESYPLYALSPVITVAAVAQQQQQATSNNAPQFASENATLSMDEDAAIGASVGDAITATDDDGDTLTYALTGSNAFAIGASSGQITVQAALDYETQSSYSLTVTVTDGKDAEGNVDRGVDDTIAVTVNIGNVDEPGAVSSQQQQQAPTVPADSPLVPAGIGAGDKFRLLFVTSATTTATSSDIADYDALARTAAGSNTGLKPFEDGFAALISTSAVDARTNTGTTGAGVPIHWLGGEKVADDYADLYDRDWDSVSGMTEGGSSYTGLVWTGGNKLGEKSGQRYAGAAEVRLGDLSDITLALSSPTARAATESYPLYALSPVITVAQSQ